MPQAINSGYTKAAGHSQPSPGLQRIHSYRFLTFAFKGLTQNDCLHCSTRTRRGGKNSSGDNFVSQNVILQGVTHPIPYLGVCCANNPQNGGYTASAPALDLQPSSKRKSFSNRVRPSKSRKKPKLTSIPNCGMPRGGDYNWSGCNTPPPSYLSKLWGGGVSWRVWGGGGVQRRVWGGGSAVGGGVPKVGGPTRDPLLPHAYSRGDVCLGRVWGSCWWLL